MLYFPVTFPTMPQVTIPSRNHHSTIHGLDPAEDSELMGGDLDSLLDKEPAEVKVLFVSLQITTLA